MLIDRQIEPPLSVADRGSSCGDTVAGRIEVVIRPEAVRSAVRERSSAGAIDRDGEGGADLTHTTLSHPPQAFD